MPRSVIVLTALLAACGGQRRSSDPKEPPANGTGQLVQGRGLTDLAFWDDSLVFVAHDRQRQDLWRVPLAGGPPTVLVQDLTAALIDGYFFFRGSRLFAPGWKPVVGGDVLFTYDPGGVPVGQDDLSLSTVVVAVRGDGAMIAGLRADGNLVFGPPGEAAEVSFGAQVDVGQLDWLGPDLIVLGAIEGQPGAGIYKVDATSRAVSPIAAPPVGSPGCSHSEVCSPQQTPMLAVGCAAEDLPCPGGGRPRCVIAYSRPDGDAPAHPFLWDAATGREIALPEALPLEGFLRSPDGHVLLWRSPIELEGNDNRLWFADACNPPRDPKNAPCQVVDCDRCRMSGGVGVTAAWRPDGRAFAAVLGTPPSDVNSFDLGPPLSCRRVGDTTRVGAFSFSPDSGRMVWTDVSDRDHPGLYLGDGLGRGGTKLADGDFTPSFAFSPDSRRLFVEHVNGAHVSLGDFDLAQESPERPIAADYYGARFGARRVLLLSDWNTQDRSGNLVLADLDSGMSASLAGSVGSFEARGDIDGPAIVAYVVQGRYGSSRDGIWTATLPGAQP